MTLPILCRHRGSEPWYPVNEWVDGKQLELRLCLACGTVEKGGDIAEWPADLQVRQWPT